MKIIKITILLAAMAFGQFAVAQDEPKGKEKILLLKIIDHGLNR